MDEQKRLLLAVVLSVVVLVGYQYFFTAPAENTNPSQEVQSREAVQSNTPANTPIVSDYTNGTGNQSQAQSSQPSPVMKNYRTISVSTPLYEIAISEHLATVHSFALKNYRETTQEDSPLKQLVPEQLVNGTLSFNMEGGSIQGLDNAIYTAGTDISSVNLSQGDKTIVFSWVNPQGISVKKIFTGR